YFFFGPGLLSTYIPLEWEGIETSVPKNFNLKTYQNDGWNVYYLSKIGTIIKIAHKPAFDVTELHTHYKRVKYKTSTGTNTYFLANLGKNYVVVYAETVEDTTVYFSAMSASVSMCTHIMEKLLSGALYDGTELLPPTPSIPLKHYWTDFIFAFSMVIPLFVVFLVFGLSGKKPANTYFSGDPIRLQEKNVFFKRIKKFGRKGSFCYLVLTATRLMAFVFGRPVMTIDLIKDKPEIQFEGKEIIIRKGGEKFALKPSEIRSWKDRLLRHL
ncbi:MAG: hypothetical protein GY765_00275, partial [bacterium]|nr:hypothetical protein [bacterium]